MIEIYILEHLQAFYEYGTLSAAAQHLNIAQPSLFQVHEKIGGNPWGGPTVIFHGMAVSSAVDIQENLLKGLKDYHYTFIILPNPVECDGMFCRKYRTEQLFLSVTPFHPAASCREVSFAELNGQSFIMYAHVGFWEEIVRSKMPDSKFFLQEDLYAVGGGTRACFGTAPFCKRYYFESHALPPERAHHCPVFRSGKPCMVLHGLPGTK